MKAVIKQSYIQKNKIARSPTLQTITMVEQFICNGSGELTKTQLFRNLPRKVMWQTFQVIMEYLEGIHKIAYDREGYVVYIWSPKIGKKYQKRSDLAWKAV